MKNTCKRRLLALLLTGAMIATGVQLPASAAGSSKSAASVESEDTGATESETVGSEETGTIAGDPETVSVSAGIQSSREADFNEGWKFYLGTSSSAKNQNFDDSGWEDVTLPHDFSISQAYTTGGEAESGFLPGGTGWYRKSFTLSPEYEGKRLVLDFGGVYENAYVYVNDEKVGENHYGYTSFAFDITDEVVCDGATENVIAVKAVNEIPSSRWYSGSGIYRDVTLVMTEDIHVDRYGTQVTTPDIASGGGTVQIATDVVNESEEEAAVTVKNTVYTKSGEAASDTTEQTVAVAAGETTTHTGSVSVANPSLWSVDSPNLYYVRTELYVDGTLKDTYDTTFGFRWINFNSRDGFELNGQKLKINGVCLHADQGALGSTASYDAMYRQLSILKEMGANAVRTSHNPHDRKFMEICNELGLMVLEDCFDGWSVAKNGNTHDFSEYFNTSLTEDNQIIGGDSSMKWYEFAMHSMVKRDRNDPCLILWSLANEVSEGASTGSDFVSIANKMLSILQEEDGSRPATTSDNTRGSNTTMSQIVRNIVNAGGVAGYNYASGTFYDSITSTYGVVLGTETTSAVNSRSMYKSQASASNADSKYHLTSYDTSAVSWGMTAHESIYNTITRDFVAGQFVWTGFDYLGEPTPWNGTGTGSVSGSGAIPNSSYFGIVETTGFPKDTYYLYRSQWKQDSSTLHLVTAWDSDNMLTTNGKTPVVVYSNAAKVELYIGDDLIGAATRQVNATDVGYQYYTYTTASNDSSKCTAVSGSGSTSLYATFNVAYQEGTTLSAKAYDESGNEITDYSGTGSVSAPGTDSRLDVSVNKDSILADGSSLAYITVDVEDDLGVLDTTATDTINFELSGDGEIVGVDNGDQATTEKYQQSSVLTSSTSAKIAAYAGKALVIVRSTKDAGSFTLTASADGLTGGSVTVTTTDAGGGTTEEGLASYTMVRDYTVRVGTKPELQTDATGTMADGTTLTGTIEWDQVTEETYNAPGDYTISGTLTFDGVSEDESVGADTDDGSISAAVEMPESLQVTCRLHVIDNVIAVRNIAAATMENIVPSLPDQVRGVLADGTLSGEFPVTWEMPDASAFATVGDIVTVTGTAAIIGTTTLPVTASVRVAEAVNTDSKNVADVATLTQDIESSKQSDTLEAVNNGTKTFEDNTSERWTNWNNRTTSATASITFSWATAQLLESANLYYYYDSCAAKPESVKFEYSLDGQTFTEIGTTEELVTSATLGAEYSYTFEKVINPVAVRITFTQQSGTTGSHCVGLIEAEMMTYAGKVSSNSSAALSGIFVDGTALSGFAADTYEYTASGTAVTAASEKTVNAGITVLPEYEGVVRILTVSEDGSDSRTYAVTLGNTQACTHENKELRNVKAASCTEEGYTGDTYCADCDALLETGATIAAVGHTTVLKNASAATCTATGYTGDSVCTVCGETIEAGTAIPALGHTWNSGVVTKEPTTTEEGVRTYTCTVCRETKTEAIDKLAAEEKKIPSVTLTAAQGTGGKIALTGTWSDYANSSQYYTVTGHGLVYYPAIKLGTRSLTVNTPGRTRVNFSKYKTDGSFTYNMKPTYANTVYVVRSFLVYTNEKGRTVYAYSDPIRVSYNSLAK